MDNDKTFAIATVSVILLIATLGIIFRDISPIRLHQRVKILEAKVAEMEARTNDTD